MCGFIAGKNLEKDLKEVLPDISYRGIDGYEGYLEVDTVHTAQGTNLIQLAHTALPIVNLYHPEAIQPLYTDANAPCLFVGEIFNYEEFGDYYHDGQAMVDAYAKRLPNHLGAAKSLQDFHKFDGFWSFVSIAQGNLLAATDYLGQKPIYYRKDVEVIASEIDILKQFGPVTPNRLFLSNVAKWGYDPMGLTPWNEIYQVPPGHYYYSGSCHRYWDWNKVEKTNLYDDMKKAVKLRMGGQRSVAQLISGGLDSTIVYGLLKEQGVEIDTPLHVNNFEKDYAELVCGKDNLIHITLEDEITDLEALQIHQSPVDLGSVKPQIAMARKLKELNYNVVMTGDGADELFGGYRRAKEYDSQYSDVFAELPYYHLPKLDRTMMRSTVELRTPYLSPQVIAHALEIPYEARNGEKKVLKETFGHLVPETILKRNKMPLKSAEIHNDPITKRMENLRLWQSLVK